MGAPLAPLVPPPAQAHTQTQTRINLRKIQWHISFNLFKMYKCDHCDYKSERIWCINRLIKNKHAPSQTGSGAEQSIQPHSQNEMQSKPQGENIDQSHENIEQYQRLQ